MANTLVFHRFALGAALLGLASSACTELDPLPATGSIETSPFTSDAVGDDYLLRVRLPPDYDPDASYPLVIQLDPTAFGLQQFDVTVGLISDHAARGEWDEAVVVGVDYPEDTSLRMRDYWPPEPPVADYSGGGADAFYRMLSEELIPELEQDYALDPARRYLVGHSNGGVFGWYAAFRHDPELGPPLFAGIVAADNGYPEVLFTHERWHAERSEDLPVTLYATRATYNGATQKVTFEAMEERLRERGFDSLDLVTQVLETDHGGAVWPSYEAGLALLLGGGA